MNRRRFLIQAPVAAAVLRSSLRGQAASPFVIQVDPEKVIRQVPSDMMGLSYESTQLGDASFFAASNSGLIELFRRLSSNGVLRLGGNTSEFTYFAPNAHAQAPAYTPLPTQPAELVAITPRALHNLRDFLERTNWSCIYGLNLGTGTPERAAEEAAAVSSILGPRLKYFQIGNEPNNYIRYKLRSSSWNAAAYLQEWIPFAKAVVARTPGARVSGPDMGAERDWMQLFAQDAVMELGESMAEVTDHFYAEGPPASPASTMQNLLQNVKIRSEIAVMQDASRKADRPCRMTEVNSCYLGGKPGVSDVAGSALWATDLTLRLVKDGFSGINFHGGSAEHIKASLGGTLPGDTLSSHSAMDSYYTPIAGSATTGFTPRPIFHGLELAGRFAGSQMLDVTAADPSYSVYAARSVHGLQLAVINLSTQAIPLRVDAASARGKAQRWTLSAPSLDSTQVSVSGPHSLSLAKCVLPAASAFYFEISMA